MERDLTTPAAGAARIDTNATTQEAHGVRAATVLMVLAVLAGAAGTADAGSPSEQRKFKSQFQGKFDSPALATGVQVPTGAGFGQTIIVAHKCEFSFFTVDSSASAGVQALAEDGSTSDFQAEVTAAVAAGNAQASWTIPAPVSPNVNSNGPNSLPVEEEFSCLTILVKINPTSDWFAGVSSYDLRSGGTWPTPGNNNNVFIDLYPFDAGTLDGTEFATSTTATSPQGTIASLRNTGKFSNNMIARLKLQLKAPALTKDVAAEEAIESIIVTWGEVAAAGGYHVMWKSGAEAFDTDGSDSRRDVVVGGKTKTHTITGLTGGVDYDVLVVAYNEAGQSTNDLTFESRDFATAISPPDPDNTVLVGNTTQRFPATALWSIGTAANGIRQWQTRAQAFTTGDETAVLGSVTFTGIKRKLATSEFDVHIYSHIDSVDGGEPGEPGDRLHTLTRPNFADVPLNSEQSVTFGTPAGETITLAANTTYFVSVIADVDDGEVQLRHTQDEDEDPESNEGWSIAYKCIMYDMAGTKANCDWHAETQEYYSLMMVLNSPLEVEKPQFSITGSEAVEGSGVQFTVSLSSALAEEATVEYSTSDDSATTADSDYTAVSGATLTFAANETEKTITITTGDDSTDEDDESFNVVLSSPSDNAQLGAITSASSLIIDNDQTTQTDGTLSSITLTGSDGNTIALTPAFSQYKFLYTATANRDLDSLTGVVTPSTSGIVQGILYVGGVEDTVSAAYDAVWALVPGDNLIKFMVTSPDGSQTKIYTIHVNKDPSTDATLSDLTLVDNNGTAITLSPAFNSATTEYTASVGAAVSSVTLTGTQNYSGATMSNNLGPDTLSGQATLDTWTGELDIEIDVTAEDGVSTKRYTVTAERTLQISFGSATYSVDEGAMVEVSVLLNGAPGDSVRADLSTTGQGGATTADFSGVPEYITFAGIEQSMTFIFRARIDVVDDAGESVKLTFGTLSTGVTAGITTETVVSITDDDAAGVSISESSLTIAEGNTDTYTVALNSQPMGDVTVTIAGAGTDLSLDNTTLTFTTTTWASAQTVTVTAVDDEIDDDGETVTLTHTVASADDSDYNGITIAGVTVTVNDNTAPLTVGMTTDLPPPVEGAFSLTFSFSETVTGFSANDIETGQDPACMDDQNTPVLCGTAIGGLETVDDRIFTTTVTPVTDGVAHNYTLTITVPANAVTSVVGNKPNEAAALEVRIAPPGVTVPISTIGLRATAGNGQVTLRWDTPANTGGATIVRYEYRWAESGGDFGDWMSVGSGTRSATVPNLTNGADYTFEVRPANALGYGSTETAVATPVVITPPPPPPPVTGGGGGGGGGGSRGRPPSYPGTIQAEGGDGEVTLTWEAPSSQGSSRIQYYEYRIDGEGEWISTGSTDRTHTIAGLINGRVYFFHLRAVSAAGAGSHRISPEATPVADLDFTHFANGGFITSTLVLVNAGAYPVRPAIYFYDQDGDPIAARSLVALTPDLEILDDGALRPRTVMNPLEELTIATHGRGGLRVGSVTVRAASSIGGVLRFDIPGHGVAGVGDSPTVRDALLPVRRQAMGINTGVAVRNRGTATLTLQCRLMRAGAVLEETVIPLAVNGQDSRYIDQVFPAADTSDFAGSVRCTAPEPGRFSAVAFELDGVNRIFTTLPVVPVPAVLDQEQEQEEEQDATRLDFTHFANGGKIVSSLVLVNAGADPVRPAIYFYDQDGGPIAAEAMLDVPADMEIGDDGALSPGTAMNPLGELTISTHGRGVLKVGSVTVTADGPIGGVLRFDIPRLGVAGVGDSPPVRDALVPVRRQDGGINTGVAVHNRGATALLVRCRLMRDGAVLEETMIPLAANGQDSRFIDQVFPTADTSDFVGSVRCMTPEPGLFSAVAFELDGVHRIFTTLPVVPVVEVP